MSRSFQIRVEKGINEKELFSFKKDRISIGSDESCDLIVNSFSVLPKNYELVVEGNTFSLISFSGGHKELIKPGSVFKVGNVELCLLASAIQPAVYYTIGFLIVILVLLGVFKNKHTNEPTKTKLDSKTQVASTEVRHVYEGWKIDALKSESNDEHQKALEIMSTSTEMEVKDVVDAFLHISYATEAAAKADIADENKKIAEKRGEIKNKLVDSLKLKSETINSLVASEIESGNTQLKEVEIDPGNLYRAMIHYYAALSLVKEFEISGKESEVTLLLKKAQNMLLEKYDQYYSQFYRFSKTNDWKTAKDSIEQALKLFPDSSKTKFFKEKYGSLVGSLSDCQVKLKPKK